MGKPLTEEEHVQVVSDIKEAFATDAGIRALRYIGDFCLENQNPLVVGSFDQTAKNCGKLSVILWIKKCMSASGLPRQEKVIQTEKDE